MGDGRIAVRGQPQKVEHLPSKCEALSSNPTARKKKAKQWLLFELKTKKDNTAPRLPVIIGRVRCQDHLADVTHGAVLTRHPCNSSQCVHLLYRTKAAKCSFDITNHPA
jgi:hypothetical protein